MPEKYDADKRPERVISSSLKPLRTLIRSLRMTGLRLRLGPRLRVGQNVYFGKRCYVAPPEFIRLGNNVVVGIGAFIETNLEIGDDVLISSLVSFVGNDHRFDDPAQTVYWNGRLPPSTVVLEGDNLIGHKVTIVGNVRIGRGCIVGAGAVVTKDLPPYTVCCGIPARPLRPRYPVAAANP